MILARESRVSGIINCEEVAMRQRLEHILKVKMQENNTILIHLVNVNDDDQSATLVGQQNPLMHVDKPHRSPASPLTVTAGTAPEEESVEPDTLDNEV